MSKLLINEPPLQVLPSLAVLIGLNEAIFIQQIHYWLIASNNEEEGRKWVYNSIDSWQRQFPFWSESTIKRIIQDLKNKEILIVGKFNKLKLDRTNWYSINYENLEILLKNESRSGQNDPTIGSICTNHRVNLTQPIPETTTEITTNTHTVLFEEIIKSWNDFAKAHNLSTVTKLTDKRKKKINSRIKNKDFDLNKILSLIAKSKFLLGENKGGWKIDFDWLIENDEHYTKILEGSYGIAQNKKYSYQEVLQITGGQISGKFKKNEDGFWYEA